MWHRFLDEKRSTPQPGFGSLCGENYLVDRFASHDAVGMTPEQLLPSLQFLLFAIRETITSDALHRYLQPKGRRRGEASAFVNKGTFKEWLETELRDDKPLGRQFPRPAPGKSNANRNAILAGRYLKDAVIGPILEGEGKEALLTAYCSIANTWIYAQWKVRACWTPDTLFDLAGDSGDDAVHNFLDRMINHHRRLPRPVRAAVDGDDLNWLSQPTTLSSEPLDFVHSSGDERERLLKRADKALFRSGSSVRVFNVHSRRMRGGLTAFATTLLTGDQWLKHRTLPALYIPLHGRMVEGSGERFDDMLCQIVDFYSQLYSEPKPVNPGDRAAMIDFVREAMGVRPALLVFDGFRTAHYGDSEDPHPLQALLSTVAQDDMLNLLERLYAEPTWSRLRPRFDRAKFLQNRCLILSDRALFHDGKAHHRHKFLKLVKGQSARLPEPDHTSIDEIIDTFGNQSPLQIAAIVEKFDKFGNFGRFEEFGIDPRKWGQADQAKHNQTLLEIARTKLRGTPRSESIYGVLSALERIKALDHARKLEKSGESGLSRQDRQADQVVLFSRSSLSADERPLLDQLVAELIPALKSKSSMWLLFLYFIALAPGGLRPKTLCRVTEYFLELKLKSHVSGVEPQIPGRAEITHEIGQFLVACNGIVGLCRVDEQYAIPHRRLPLVWREKYSLQHEECELDRSIMFAFEEASDLFLVDALKRKKGNEFLGAYHAKSGMLVALLHALLSEEAYTQFVQGTRYNPTQSDSALDQYHRLITAIYHGGASLMDHQLDHDLQVPEGVFFLPCDPKRRWVALYALLFRHQLDRHPSMELVNRYDVAELRQDILQLFARPQLWNAKNKAQWRALNLGDDTASKDIARAFYRDLWQSGHAVSRDSPMPWAELGFGWTDQARAQEVAEPSQVLFFDWKVDELSNVGEVREDNAKHTIEDLKGLIAELEPVDATCRASDVITTIMGLVKSFANGKEDPEIVQLDAARLDALAKPWVSMILQNGAQLERKEASLRIKKMLTWLALLGEAHGWDGERYYANFKGNSRRVRNFDESTSRYARSFATFFLCDALRRAVFWSYPTSDAFRMYGRRGRSYIRVCLKLARMRHRYTPSGDLFWQQAQTTSDRLARHLSRFPRERAAILILDAAITRYEAARRPEQAISERRNILDMALECLAQAEKIVLTLGMHNRLRLRFSLERCKVLLACAEAHSDKKRKAKLYLDMSSADADLIAALAENRGYWKRLAEVQTGKIKALRESLG